MIRRKLAKLVSVPYEITLLSNDVCSCACSFSVSVPYEITLLSNVLNLFRSVKKVSVPYEITLLSNGALVGFSVGLFQYLMKLHYSQTIIFFPS